MRAALVLTMLGLLAHGPALADGEPGTRPKPVPHGPARGARAKSIVFTPEREAAALTFVRSHHPELAALLERLRPMNQAEYEQAIGDLFQVSESLANLKQRDPKRFELGLEAWKARSRVELLTAQLASAPGAELESQLRQAVAAQIDTEIRQHQLDRELAESRAHKAQEAIDRLERRHDALVESRVQTLLKKSRNARRKGAAPTSAPPARTSPAPRDTRP